MKLFILNFRSVALSALALFALSSRAQAQITVSWGTESEGRYLATASGSLLPAGSLVWLGSFTAATDFAGHATDFAYLSSRFTLLGSATIGSGGFTGFPGAFAAANVVSAINTQLSYWAFDASTAASATQWGIFTQTTGLWTTPGAMPTSLNTDLVDANLAYVGSLTAIQARTAIIGGQPSTVPDSSLLLFEAFLIGVMVIGNRRREPRP